MQTTKVLLTGLTALAIAGTAKASLYGDPLVPRSYASDYPGAIGAPTGVFVVPTVSLPAGTLTSFETYDQNEQGGSPFPSAGNTFNAYVLQPTGTPNQFTVVLDSGTLTVPVVASSQIVSFALATPFHTVAGDEIAFFGQGIPVDINSGSPELYYPSTAAPTLNQVITLGSADFPQFNEDRLYSFAANIAPVPEPTTVISAALLLLPFGASAVRVLRRNKSA